MSENKKIVAYVERDMEEFIPFFLEESKEEIRGLIEALKAGDYKSLKDFGHKIKGSSVTCSEGFQKMSDIGLAIENAAKEKKPLKEIQVMVKAYIEYVNNVEIIYTD
ncbi:Hpt domain-containing protein [Desulfonema limicola]|uniref:Hpt domain-containing protein n=1 Tax=Desulfonema limicola TaxID=45656 RepID=A0A975B511_9BACT|nr:Hpt domain-containing protein [Desulfonema limicola]QTA78925.1 Hpt domain-containing protein [Desulfonema limicola]